MAVKNQLFFVSILFALQNVLLRQIRILMFFVRKNIKTDKNPYTTKKNMGKGFKIICPVERAVTGDKIKRKATIISKSRCIFIKYMLLYRNEGILYIFFLILGFLLLAFLVRWFIVHKETVSFFTTGVDSGFSIPEIISLWKLAKLCELEEPSALYLSVPALNRSISQLLSMSRADGTEFSPKTQKFLTKLYAYRTKVELDPLSKKGLKSTKYVEEGQKIRIVLKGVGVFASKIEINGRELIVHVPSKNGIITMYGSEWVGKKVSVYLWRKDDACYAFDTTVLSAGQYASVPVLYLAHSSDLTRVQKRKSVRTKCNISARIYLPNKNFSFDTTAEEPAGGYRCVLEDISADGALVRIGGRGVSGINIKLQFSIADNFVVMVGIVRAVEYNVELNQSRLHFECLKIDPELRNVILSFVYDVMPEEERDAYLAMQEMEEEDKITSSMEAPSVQTNLSSEVPSEQPLVEPNEGNISKEKDETAVSTVEDFAFPQEEQ